MNVTAPATALPPLDLREMASRAIGSAKQAAASGLVEAKQHDFAAASALIWSGVEHAQAGVGLALRTSQPAGSPHYEIADDYLNALKVAASRVTGLSEVERLGVARPEAQVTAGIAETERWLAKADEFAAALWAATAPDA